MPDIVDIEFSAQHVNTAPQNIVSAFRRDGMVILRQCLPPKIVQALQQSLEAPNLHTLAQASNTLEVGDKRFSQSLKLDTSIHTPAVYANPLWMPLVHELLGSQHILSSVVNVVSLPGATLQHLHRDHPPLFDAGIDRLLPPHALKVYMALTNCNTHNGSTTFFTKSHNSTVDFEDETQGFTPELSPGDVVLFDYRLYHQGTANNSQQTRQVLFLSYSRHWFLDAVNFTKKARINADPAFFEAMPKEYQYLLAWRYQ